ncbi:hypothetical protein JCM19238_3620 [Vibrio ponticus]|nr:hypothetical protein JCM19238_3620 [Vibrio ponticus]
MSEEVIGRDGEIVKRDETVVRPLNRWSTTVHLLLQHLHDKGIENCPRLVAVEGEYNEVLTFVSGDCYDYPLQGAIASELALESAAKLLRRLHDASADFLSLHQHEDLVWMLPPREPYEVICHGDYSPYNVALSGEQVSGVFDFDTAHPAPRIWDVAYGVYCFAPFKTDPVDALGSLSEQVQRARIFCDAYQLSEKDRQLLVDTMVMRLQTLVDFIHQQAQQGNAQFVANIRDGHDKAYIKDIDYIKENHQIITAGLLD